MGHPTESTLTTEFFTRNATTIQNLWDGGYIHGWDVTDWGTDWHTTRVVRDTTGALGNGPRLLVFIDGELKEFFDILQGDTAKGKTFAIGADTTGTLYNVEWDYVRAHNTALAPTEALNQVPEPTTMVLLGLGLGGLALIRRKR